MTKVVQNDARVFSIPNLLTYGRILAVPLIVLLFFVPNTLEPSAAMRWFAFWVFVIASLTDWLDGYLARKWNETSNIGRMLDPIADKLLVSVILLILAADGTIAGWSIWAGVIILCREILVSGLREYLASAKVSVPVSQLAKWKTTVQLVAIGLLVLGPAGNDVMPYVTEAGLTLLWIAALLTLYTGYDYFRSGMRHVMES
ncbi:MAG: CDP-diacylglycerol--glycerol-3-phosphate 3-phosphatidyltransferase [Pseudomonadota bacterium]